MKKINLVLHKVEDKEKFRVRYQNTRHSVKEVHKNQNLELEKKMESLRDDFKKIYLKKNSGLPDQISNERSPEEKEILDSNEEIEVSCSENREKAKRLVQNIALSKRQSPRFSEEISILESTFSPPSAVVTLKSFSPLQLRRDSSKLTPNSTASSRNSEDFNNFITNIVEERQKLKAIEEEISGENMASEKYDSLFSDDIEAQIEEELKSLDKRLKSFRGEKNTESNENSCDSDPNNESFNSSFGKESLSALNFLSPASNVALPKESERKEEINVEEDEDKESVTQLNRLRNLISTRKELEQRTAAIRKYKEGLQREKSMHLTKLHEIFQLCERLQGEEFLDEIKSRVFSTPLPQLTQTE
ncbi:hypothetical protein ABK040_014936 [Willaertia magna]